MASIQKTAKSTHNGWWNEDTKLRVIIGLLAIPSIAVVLGNIVFYIDLYTGWLS